MTLAELAQIVGPQAVVTDPERLATHTRDWTGRWQGHTPAVVFPSTTDQVVGVVEWCRREGVAVVPQGGNTGMVGGSVPLDGEIVLSSTRMREVLVDADAGTATVEAGATVAEVQAAATAAGWRYGVDLGARDSATIGGTIATNAGGLHVMRHGDTRRQLLGIQAVTGAGEVVGDLRGLVKDNTGYHLPSLLAGSEGTLAVVTRACLRLVAPAAETVVALLGFADAAAAVAAVSGVRLGVPGVQAIELFLNDGLNLVCERFGLPRPLDDTYGAYLLVEAAGDAGIVERVGAAVEAMGVTTPGAVAVAADRSRRERLWRYREAHTEAIATLGVPHKLDVTLPLQEMARFVDEVRTTVAAHAPGSRTWIFGHAGDGNLHVNVTGAAIDDDALDARVLELVAAAGGSISAEHGIGRAKARYLRLNRTPAELDLARRLKAAFDPAGILNPGVLLT